MSKNDQIDRPRLAAKKDHGDASSAAETDRAHVAESITPSRRDYHELAAQLIKEVIEPVSGPLGPNVKVSVTPEPPTLVLEHAATSPKGKEHLFRYEINLDGQKISPGPLPQLGEPSKLEFLPGPYSPEMLSKMQDAFRCACIHDPALYGRFSRKELRLEDYQNQAVEAALSDLNETGRSLLVLGTGGGKTQIAFEIAASELNRSPNLEDAVVVFVVNNNVILSEAGEKFVERFNEEFSKSHAHGGKRDISGNVVFTTPGTLLGDSRIEALMASKKQVLFIFDEVHHIVASQPDEIIKQATDLGKTTGTEVRFLGMTATETRPDLKSVLSYFNNHITFEQPAATLTSRGFLVQFAYHAADEWLYPDQQAPTVILPTDETATERRQLLNSDEAFVHIEHALDTHVRDREDRRTLIVAPSVHLAGECTWFLNNNDSYKGTVVRLTAEDRAADPERFKDTYEAWKKGRWPEGSKFSHEPVPEIVVAVDLFKEGADAPAVRTIINWADTNSLIVFLQTLGRGLRPDPFKTNLTVVDVAGTFRKVHLLQYLGDAADPRNEQDRPGTDLDPDEGDKAEKIPTEIRPLCDLGPEVSRTVQQFMADVAACISRRYPHHHYSAIPAQELEKLHGYLAEQCGCESILEFDNLLKEIATTLSVDTSMQAAHEARQKLLKPFFTNGELQIPPSGHLQIDREERNFLIHTHLSQAMQVLVPEITPKHIARVFPEFSAETLDSIKTIGGNIMTLRHRYFNLKPADMAAELLKSVVKKGFLSHDPNAEIAFYCVGQNPGDDNDIVSSVEARRMSRAHPENGAPLGWEQRAFLLAFLQHPDIKGKLGESDFLLPRKEFENLLATKNLIGLTDKQASSDVLRFISDKLNDVTKAISQENVEAITKSSQVANSLLTKLLEGVFLEEATITRHRFEALQKTLQTVGSTGMALPALQEMTIRLEDVIGKICKREVANVSSIPGVSVSIQQRPEARYLLLTIEGPQITESLELPMCTEFVHPHFLIPSGRLLDLADFYDGLTNIEKQDFVATITTQIDKMLAKLPLSSQWSEMNSPVVVVPTASKGITKDIGVALLRDTQLDVLTVGGVVSPITLSAYNLELSISQALRSRVGDVTEENLNALRQLCRANYGKALTHDLLHAYEVLTFARNQVALHSAQWKALFEHHALGGDSLRYVEAARAPLVRLLEHRTTIGPKRLPFVKTYTNMLQTVAQAGGFTDESALVMAAWTAWDRVPFGAYELKGSPFLKLKSDMQTFFRRWTQALQSGVEMSSEDTKSMTEVLRTLFDATHGATKQKGPYIVGFQPEEQTTEVANMREKIVGISERLANLLATQRVETEDQREEQDIKPRKEGHPFFDSERNPRLFLSGSTKAPTVHLDPECALRTKDLAKRKKQELPLTPVTFDDLEATFGYKEKITCCKGCKMPTWRDQENYADVRNRFSWNSTTSAALPTELETPPST